MFEALRVRVLAVTITCASALAVAALPAVAGASEEKGQTMKMPSSMAELLKMSPEHCMQMMDTAHKGFVTKEDFMKFQEQLWGRMDKNKDDVVDKAEWGGKAAPGGG